MTCACYLSLCMCFLMHWALRATVQIQTRGQHWVISHCHHDHTEPGLLACCVQSAHCCSQTHTDIIHHHHFYKLLLLPHVNCVPCTEVRGHSWLAAVTASGHFCRRDSTLLRGTFFSSQWLNDESWSESVSQHIIYEFLTQKVPETMSCSALKAKPLNRSFLI